MLKPGGKLVSEEVAGSIVRFIAGGAELANAEVEPALLSLICRELNNARIAQGRSEISADLLAGSRDTILADFYERALADQPPGVRQFIEDNLLTESGHRESLAEERVQKGLTAAGALPDALATLVNRRLLRIEERLDVRRVELTHDVLCGVVRASRDVRLEREARDEAERKLAAQRERELATRKALVRARKIAAVCAVLAVGAAGSAVFGYFGMKRAQQAEAKAQQTRQMAEAARGEAEKLIVYLLDDFYLELEPVGRLDIVAELAEARASTITTSCPPRIAHGAKPTATARWRWCATARVAHAVQARRERQGLVRSGRRPGQDAARRRPIGKHGDRPGIGPCHAGAAGDSRQSREARKRCRSGACGGSVQAAGGRAEPDGTGCGGPMAAMTYQGYRQMRDDQEEAAVKTLEVAREVLRGIDGLEDRRPAVGGGLCGSHRWQVER